MSEFVHLHVHTDYSMLDGACRVKDLVEQAKAFHMPALACTDHGNMCAAIEFYQACSEKGIQPIIGCEMYVAPGSCLEKDARHPHVQGFHLVLLAETMEGYENLCRLNSAAWRDGFYYKPRIDKTLLARHRGGLIALTACLGGEISTQLIEGTEAKAVQALQEYLDIFGREAFFLELQDHGLPEEAEANQKLIALGGKFGVPLVVTNDSHYLRKEHAAAHGVLLCIGTQTTLADPKRLRFSGEQFYFKSADEMQALFPHQPEALKNTLAIAERCRLTLKLGDKAENHYPVYLTPDQSSREDFLRRLCLEGMRTRYGVDPSRPDPAPADRDKLARLDFELGVIAKTGFTSYFLVVWDFLDFARGQGIPIGPGRGSGAGSIVAYLTRITDIDPLRYGLLFERFLNPERVSPPDFDIDLCERRRQEVIAYVRGKYGEESVAQIGTFGTLKAKQVLKDVARVMGRPFADGNLLTKLVPNDPKMTLSKALDDSQELKDLVEKETWVQEVVNFSKVLEGLNRNMSIHAAGVIIGNQPLNTLVPLGRGAEDEIITQYPAAACEALGLLKLDFLGLKTLTIIDDTLQLVAKTRGTAIDIAAIPLDNSKTFDLLNRGDTVAVFQLESSGMRDLCRRFGVTRIEDIIALIALYRPGPMQFLDEFIARKTGQTPTDYDVPEMEALLAETYGIMLYQEQVMQVVQKVAGFTLGQADILRRAMGKKKVKEMEAQYSKFVDGCAKNNIDSAKAGAIWQNITKFAGYGFNKSHSAAYAFLSYRTAYLKANYPVEFMAAVLTSDLGNADRLAFFLQECRGMGIAVKPPDVNVSGRSFTVDADTIRFGLAAIKGVGESAADAITEARATGPFKGLTDFCERTADKVNRRVLECLCKAGAFDGFGLRRAQLLQTLDDVLARAQQTATDRSRGQGSLFEFGAATSDFVAESPPPDIPEWPQRELLAFEKELLGVYVTGHPLAECADVIRTFQTSDIADLSELASDTPVRIGGIVTSVDVKRAKKDQRKWAIVKIEGLAGSIECLAFADTYEAVESVLQPDAIVFIEGMLNSRDDEVKVLVEKVLPVATAPETFTSEMQVRIPQKTAGTEALSRFVQLCKANAGDTPLLLCLLCASGDIAFVKPELNVRNTAAFRQGVLALFGSEAIREKAKPVEARSRGPRRPPAARPPRNDAET